MTFTYRVLLKPSDICFKNNFLPSSFDNGIPLQETLQRLANEEMLLEDIPAIDVVWCQKQWVWYTLNNRRLWVFRELEKLGKCQYIATKRVETIEHATDFLLYGSAELIGEGNNDIVEWTDDVFDDGELSGKKATESSNGARKETKLTKESKEGAKIRRDWRELTPLTVTVSWNEAGIEESDADDERMVTPDPNKQECRTSRAESKESKRERKDSGYSEISSGRTSPGANGSGSESEFGENESSEEKKPSSRRFSRFHRDRPSLDPLPSASRSYADSSRVTTPRAKNASRRIKRSTRPSRPRRKRVRRPQTRAVTFRRRDTYDSMMFLLHHGGKSRLEQLRLKTRLMNTCGFCFKSFKTTVSLSQHVEELEHWACTRCGKYFESYTALGQHKLALDHCNVY